MSFCYFRIHDEYLFIRLTKKILNNPLKRISKEKKHTHIETNSVLARVTLQQDLKWSWILLIYNTNKFRSLM